MEFETANDLKTAVEKLDQSVFKESTVTCTADVSPSPKSLLLTPRFTQLIVIAPSSPNLTFRETTIAIALALPHLFAAAMEMPPRIPTTIVAPLHHHEVIHLVVVIVNAPPEKTTTDPVVAEDTALLRLLPVADIVPQLVAQEAVVVLSSTTLTNNPRRTVDTDAMTPTRRRLGEVDTKSRTVEARMDMDLPEGVNEVLRALVGGDMQDTKSALLQEVTGDLLVM